MKLKLGAIASLQNGVLYTVLLEINQLKLEMKLFVKFHCPCPKEDNERELNKGITVAKKLRNQVKHEKMSCCQRFKVQMVNK